MNALKASLVSLIFITMSAVGTTLALDAYELEQTADCDQCVLLHYIK